MLVFRREAQLSGCVAAQMLVRQKKHAVALVQGPAQHGFGIGRGADRAAVFPHHGLERQGGVDVGQGHDAAARGAQLLQHAPGQARRGHERHHAVGVRRGQMHGLPWFGQQGRGLAHEKNPAEDNVFRVHARHAAGQLQRVAGDVAVGRHRVALIMVAHDAEPLTQLCFQRRHGGGDLVHALIHRYVEYEGGRAAAWGLVAPFRRESGSC